MSEDPPEARWVALTLSRLTGKRCDDGMYIRDVQIPCSFWRICLKATPAGSRPSSTCGGLSGWRLESAERGCSVQIVNNVHQVVALKVRDVCVKFPCAENTTQLVRELGQWLVQLEERLVHEQVPSANCGGICVR